MAAETLGTESFDRVAQFGPPLTACTVYIRNIVIASLVFAEYNMHICIYMHIHPCQCPFAIASTTIQTNFAEVCVDVNAALEKSSRCVGTRYLEGIHREYNLIEGNTYSYIRIRVCICDFFL